MFEHIEKLKRAFTDKYVVVDAARPELTRFRNATGLIKTINMNGRALVEFDQWDNIGWYDIELDFLKVVPKPEPKPAEAKKEAPAKAAPKPAAEKPAAAAKPAAAGAKASTADILAAARAKKAGGETATAAPAAKPAPAAPTAKPAAAAPAGKMSTSDILAMARGKAAAAAAAPAAAPAKKTAPPKPEPVVEEEPAAVAAPVAAPAKPAKAAASGPLPTTTAEKIAYCRKVDAKG
ncbi:MAG TPA: hypothetical protein VGJ15_08905 [Pirellulales bacterium]